MADGWWSNILGNGDKNAGGGFWSSLIPALAIGGLSAGSSYLSNKQQGESNAAQLKLQQEKFEFEKELALRQLAESGGGKALQAAIAKAQLEAERQKMIQAAYQSAAAAALRAGEGSAANLNAVGGGMYRPFVRG